MSSALASLDLKTNDPHFEAGMKQGAAELHDPLKPTSKTEPAWEDAFMSPQRLHGVILVAGSDVKNCQAKLDKIKNLLGSSMKITSTVSGKTRPGKMDKHEQSVISVPPLIRR